MRKQRMTPNCVRSWEYQSFAIPQTGGDRALLSWLREGWELIGIHRKAWPANAPMAIMRREFMPDDQ